MNNNKMFYILNSTFQSVLPAQSSLEVYKLECIWPATIRKYFAWSEEDLLGSGPVLQPFSRHLPHHAEVVLHPAVVVAWATTTTIN